jgi:hypothetical protein
VQLLSALRFYVTKIESIESSNLWTDDERLAFATRRNDPPNTASPSPYLYHSHVAPGSHDIPSLPQLPKTATTANDWTIQGGHG